MPIGLNVDCKDCRDFTVYWSAFVCLDVHFAIFTLQGP